MKGKINNTNASYITFDEFCEGEYFMENKVLIVPNMRYGTSLKKIRNFNNKPCFNLKCLSLFDIAKEIFEKSELALNNSLDNIPNIIDNNGYYFIVEIVKSICHDEKFNYFKEEWLDVYTCKEIYKNIIELKMSDLDNNFNTKNSELNYKCYFKNINVEDNEDDSTRKLKDLELIINEYNKLLEEKKMVDYADVYINAIENIDKFKDGKPIIYAATGNLELTSLEEKFFEKLIENQEHITIKIPAVYYKDNQIDPPTNYICKNKLGYEIKNKFSYMYSNNYIEEIDKCNNIEVDFFKAYGQSNEVKYIFKDIINKEISLDDVQVIYPDESYEKIIESLSQKFDIPIILDNGISAKYTNVYALFRDIFKWTLEGYKVSDLERVLNNDSLALGKLVNSHLEIKKQPEEEKDNQDDIVNDEIRHYSISKRRIYKRVADTCIGWGKDRYKAFFENRLEELQLVKNEEISEEQIKAINNEVKIFFDTLFEIFPEELDGAIEFSKVINGILNFGNKYLNNRDKKVSIVLSSLRSFKDISDSIAATGKAKDLFEFILDEIASIRITTDDKLGAIHFIPYGKTQIIDAKNLYVIGLDGGRFPNSKNESPILLDEERKKYTSIENLAKGKEHEQIYKFVETLATASERVVLGYSNYDTVELRENNQSSVYNQALALFDTKIEDVKAFGFVVEDEKDILEERDVYLHYKQMERKQEEQDLKEVAATEETTLQQEEGSKKVITPINKHYSATSMTTLLECPRKYYYERILNMKVDEELEYSIERWLPSNVRGTFIHAVLEGYVNNVIIHKYNLINDKDNFKIDFDEVAFNNIFENCNQRILEICPYVVKDNYERESAYIKEVCKNYIVKLHEDMEKEKFIPIATELSFGIKGKSNNEFSSELLDITNIDEVKIDIDDNNIFYLKGSIDRVDKLNDNKYRIIDYKTGSKDTFKEKIDCGLILQHYLYTIALEKILDKEVSVSQFDFVINEENITIEMNENNLRINMKNKIKELFKLINTEGHIVNEQLEGKSTNEEEEEFLKQYKNLIRDKKFNEKNCKYCDFSSICKKKNGVK